MSDDERLDLRNLPPVPSPPRPARLSQTAARHADNCLRSAYLYFKHHGGAPSHAMDRGTVVHEFGERMVLELLGHPDRPRSLYEHEVNALPNGAVVAEDYAQAERSVATITKVMVDEILDARPELNVCRSEADAAREMAFHMAVGFDVDPSTVVGIERKFVLDLECGWTLSGKIDLASLPEDTLAQVDDFKTSFAVPTQQEFEESFQTPLYGVLLMFGQPVEKVPCLPCNGTGSAGPEDPTVDLPCEACKRPDGRAFGWTEVRHPCVGEELRKVRTRQVYPRPKLRRDGDGRLRMVTREHTWTRTELADFRMDLERLGRRISWAFETGNWPAVPGAHCSECPSAPECPLPAHLRRWEGRIDSHERAAEALAWALRQGELVRKTNAQVKKWAGENGPVVLGDELFGVEVKPKRELKKRNGGSDWDGLVAALEVSARYGEPFDVRAWVREGTTNSFGRLKVAPELVDQRRREVQDGRAGVDAADGAGAGSGRDDGGELERERDERFGADAPY